MAPFSDEEESFDSLSHLVDHYKDDADGLCTKLEEELPRLSLTANSISSSSASNTNNSQQQAHKDNNSITATRHEIGEHCQCFMSFKI